MSGAEIMTAVGFIVMLMGFLFGLWKYIDGKLTALRNECSAKIDAAAALAALARSELAQQKLHVAETYVTKAGMSEQTAQIMKALESIGSRIDSLGERMDNIMLRQAPRTRT